MPPVTRWAIRLSLVHLVLGAVLTAVAAVPGWAGAVPGLAAMAPASLHLWTIGWLSQLIFGVAHWLFPKHRTHPPRGRTGVMVFAVAALNAGLVLRLAAEPLVGAYGPGGGAGWVLVAASTLLWLAGLAFAVHIWGRVHG